MVEREACAEDRMERQGKMSSRGEGQMERQVDMSSRVERGRCKV